MGGVRDLTAEQKALRSQVNFLMDGRQEMEAAELYALLQQTQIEDFDEVKEAFNLLDVNGDNFLTLETFKNIFEKLELGKIEKQDEDIFKEVTKADDEGKITFENFKSILAYTDQQE